ncbi:protein of unassigned function [Methylobacterium oryzae CBMB20]|uniref:Protein of unassigned function n=1 Tax=Methylobacterium oryzae CBMB20 TaxID=693986 RepID=A0A089P6C2_9HYPH|nr:protein of unassigned function [Methylobacterium oryzae CBMB20]
MPCHPPGPGIGGRIERSVRDCVRSRNRDRAIPFLGHRCSPAMALLARSMRRRPQPSTRRQAVRVFPGCPGRASIRTREPE